MKNQLFTILFESLVCFRFWFIFAITLTFIIQNLNMAFVAFLISFILWFKEKT